MNEKIETYQEFWPYYLREHSQPVTRAWHYFGTALSLLILGAAILSKNGWLIFSAVISGYFFAWISHAVIEKNRPATFTYPLWSLASDFRMLFCFLTGRMSRELEKAGLLER